MIKKIMVSSKKTDINFLNNIINRFIEKIFKEII